MDRLDALRLYIAVAETGSFSAVARQQAIAVSTVSLAVKQLEEEFRTRLLARSTRQLALTHEGMTLLSDARRIVSEWDASIGGLGQDSVLSGPIRLTATNDFGRARILPLVDEFQALHPQLSVTLLLSDSNLDLIEDHIDVALRYGPLPDSSNRARLLLPGRRLVCAAPSYWQRMGRPEHPNQLAAHNCLVLARPGATLASWPFRDETSLFHVKVRGDRQTSDGDVLRHWAVKGFGVTLKNSSDVSRELGAGTLEAVLQGFNAGPVDLYALHHGGHPSRRVTALLDFLAEALRTTA
ncbi:DNA-binding transcriptional regulator, LysR family [Paracidovorax cattleyae]|uniref:DNA-binding transcriptional regulator, LysR family n=2 Tax=Paracidovorax cattleyae TaxID=80868 RepID=A0A1H0RNT8_9BURK|nr:LysR family transcriptional regulator [Paracidovorax cattleyae]MBF9264848.1 LysR family transcriptional regulator [Paracidovorax cattleyae]SDP31117.1 DNA-binding transcriptional regulator, LysR family [Paracidovorax cattleyae]